MYWTSIKNNKLKEENDRINLVVLFQFVFCLCFVSAEFKSRRNLSYRSYDLEVI